MSDRGSAKTVVIDCFPESVERYRDRDALVAIDVIRATTTAVTAIATGRRCFPVPTLEEATEVAAGLVNPLLAGELGGNTPYGFDLTNSPAEIALRTDRERPMVLLSTSGTRVICGGSESQTTYVACLRNVTAQVRHLSEYHSSVAIIGAGARGEFREEDALCCAWIAEGLIGAGFQPEDENTASQVRRWHNAPAGAIADGHSAEYLRRTGQTKDLMFILAHLDDLDQVYPYNAGEIVEWDAGGSRASSDTRKRIAW
ncbi:MAG: 2-phosphosulfolactate phosphatase [Chloroflexota bacterium]